MEEILNPDISECSDLDIKEDSYVGEEDIKNKINIKEENNKNDIHNIRVIEDSKNEIYIKEEPFDLPEDPLSENENLCVNDIKRESLFLKEENENILQSVPSSSSSELKPNLSKISLEKNGKDEEDEEKEIGLHEVYYSDSKNNFGIEFYSDSRLVAHFDSKMFRCAECKYETKLKRRLKAHLLIHSSYKKFKCSDCPYETNRKDHLKSHMVTHSKSELYQCSECKYKTKRKRDLNFHLLTHSAANFLKCSQCEYKTVRKDHLKTHLLTHSNQKLFKCSDCDYEANQKASLKVHLLKHSHGLKKAQTGRKLD